MKRFALGKLRSKSGTRRAFAGGEWSNPTLQVSELGRERMYIFNDTINYQRRRRCAQDLELEDSLECVWNGRQKIWGKGRMQVVDMASSQPPPNLSIVNTAHSRTGTNATSCLEYDLEYQISKRCDVGLELKCV